MAASNNGDDWDFKLGKEEPKKATANREQVREILEKRPVREKKLDLDQPTVVQNVSRRNAEHYINTKGGKNTAPQFKPALLTERAISIMIDCAAVTGFWMLGRYFGKATIKFLVPLLEQYQLRYLLDHDYVYYVITGINFSLLYLLLWVPLATYTGKTPGKFSAKIYIEDVDGGGIGFMRTLLRETLYKFISLVSIFGPFMFLFHKERRSLHDLLAKTTVRRS